MGKVTRLPPQAASQVAISDYRRFLRGSSGLVVDDDALIGRKGLRQLEEMWKTDETCRAAIQLKRAAVCGPGWRLDPAEDTNLAREVADTLTADLVALPGSLEASLAEVLSALWAGFSCTEKTYDLDGPRIRLASLRTIRPDSLQPEQDAYGRIVSWSQAHVGGPANIPPQKLIHFTHNAEFGSSFGTSDLIAAYRPWFQKRNVSQWLMVHMERLADPPIVATTPAGVQAEQVDHLLNVLNRISSKTALVTPEGFSLDLLESSRDPKSVFISVIDHLNLMISRSILLPEKSGLSTGAQEVGAFAASRAQIDLFMLILAGLRQRLMACIQEQLITEAAELAFGAGAPVPLFQLAPLSEDDKHAVVNTFTSAVTAGVVVPTDEDGAHIRAMLSFPKEAGIALTERDRGGASQHTRRCGGLAYPRGASPRTLLKRDQHAPPAAPWRPLTRFEERSQVENIRTLHDTGAQELGTVLANGSAAIIRELKAAVPPDGKMDPDAIVKLRPSAETMAKLREKVFGLLQEGYAGGAAQALNEVDAARAEAPPPQSSER